MYLRNRSTTAERNTELSRQRYCLQRSWKQLKSPSGENGPPPGDGDKPGPGPSWGTAWTSDLFPWAPSGLAFGVPSYESFPIYPLWVPIFSFAIFYFGLNGWIFMIQSVPPLIFVSIIYLSEVSLKITIFIFIFLWFTLTQSHPSLSYEDLHHSKATLSLSCLVCYSLPLTFRVVISPCFVFCCLKESTCEERGRRKGNTAFIHLHLYSSQCLLLLLDTTFLSDKIPLQPEELPSSFLRVQISWEHVHSALIPLKVSLFILNVWKMILLDAFLFDRLFIQLHFLAANHYFCDKISSVSFILAPDME